MAKSVRRATVTVSHPDIIKIDETSLALFESMPLLTFQETMQFLGDDMRKPWLVRGHNKKDFYIYDDNGKGIINPDNFFNGERTNDGFVLAKKGIDLDVHGNEIGEFSYISLILKDHGYYTISGAYNVTRFAFLMAKLPKIYVETDPSIEATVVGNSENSLRDVYTTRSNSPWEITYQTPGFEKIYKVDKNAKTAGFVYVSTNGVVDRSKLYFAFKDTAWQNTFTSSEFDRSVVTEIFHQYNTWDPISSVSSVDDPKYYFSDIEFTISIPDLSYGATESSAVSIIKDAWIKITIPIAADDTYRILTGESDGEEEEETSSGGGISTVVVPPPVYTGAEPPTTPEATVDLAAKIVANTVNTPVNPQMFTALTAAAAFMGPDAFRRSRIAVLLSGGDPLGAAEAFADINTYIDLRLDRDEKKALDMAVLLMNALAPYKDAFLSGGILNEFGEYQDTPQSIKIAESQPGYVPRPTFLPNAPVGFSDPQKQYPRPTHYGEPDTSRIVRQERARASSIQKKELGRHREVIMANQRGTWSQPPAGYNAQYPYNQSTVTESGHVFELDDTPGSERIHLYHRSGTFTEIDNNGTMVRRTVGDDYTILERDGRIHIIGRADVTVQGAASVRVENTLDLEVHGVTNINIFNHANIRVAGDTTIKASGNVSARVLKSVNITADQSITLASKDNININSGKDIVLKAKGKLDLNSKSGTVLSSGGKTEIGSTNTINIQGSKTFIQSGGARRGGAEPPVIGAVESDPMFEPKKVVLPPLAPFNRVEAAGAVYESPDEGSPDAWKEKRIREGTSTATALDSTPEAKATEMASTGREPKPVDVQVPAGREFRADDKLSKYFQLKDLTKNYSRRLTNNFGTTAEDKFKALSYLCTNALDVIKEKYPSMVITSGLRDFVPPGGATKSQHLTGEAVDIQFPGLDRKGHMQRAKEISALIPFDQLLLEYTTPGGNGWIHISLKPNPRKQVFTMNNHRKISKDGELIAVA